MNDTRLLYAGLALLLLSTPRLAAQDPRLETRLPPAARAGVAAAIRQAQAEALPTEPLVQRALEGASRGAEPARIVDAVADLASRLRSARAALGAGAGETELIAAAAALHAGLSEAELRQLRATEPRQSLALPLVTLADLLERGVPSGTSTSVILSLVNARMPAEAYARLRQSVAQDISLGAPPAAAAQTRAQGLLLERRPPPRRGPAAGRPPRPQPGPGPGRGPPGRPLP